MSLSRLASPPFLLMTEGRTTSRSFRRFFQMRRGGTNEIKIPLPCVSLCNFPERTVRAPAALDIFSRDGINTSSFVAAFEPPRIYIALTRFEDHLGDFVLNLKISRNPFFS